MESELARGREAFATQAWSAAYGALTAAAAEGPLSADDLERFAVVCQLIGHDDESDDRWARAHHEHLRQGDPKSAARCAFWLGFGLVDRGEFARGGGWLSRADRTLQGYDGDCSERGYLLIPGAMHVLEAGDPPAALAMFAKAAEIAERFGDEDLTAMSRLGQGASLMAAGRIAEGLNHLDEAMVVVTTGAVSPFVVGTVYCAVIEACQRVFDLGRAREWTTALGRWCDAQPDLVPYRGQCLVYRAEIMRLQGEWADALVEAQLASERLPERTDFPAVGAAHYLVAEVHRLRGHRDEAEAAYREANRTGKSPYPGMALLRLAQGRTDAAVAGIARALDESEDPVSRATLLPARVEIGLAAHDDAVTRAAADELASIADELKAPFLQAAAGLAAGAVDLADGNAVDALPALRGAERVWQALEAPYETARSRMLIASACRVVGDEDGAELAFDAARRTFELLGAAPDLSRLDEVSRGVPHGDPLGVLTTREVEVIRLVASGMTNRAIARQLVISEKTVARHLSNIFTKLDVSSRSGATAYAYEHGLA
jgi:DNA-binding CsgD family transcriptional regulator/tetratricopeptide (TPR) repeat protein